MKLSKNKTKALLLTHYNFRVEGGRDTDERLLFFIKDRVKKAVLITNPFPESTMRTTFCFVYKNGKKVKEINIYNPKLPFLIHYLYQTFVIYFLLLRVGFNYDLCISLENLSFAVVYPLKALGVIKRLVYYSIDLAPSRFANKILNSIYRKFYKFACQHSDTNWVMAKNQIEGSKLFGVTEENSSPFSLAPIGYELKDINLKKTNEIDIYNLVYAGGIRESHGPQLAVQSLPHLIKKNPKIHLTIVGGGKYLDQLENLVTKLKLQKYVTFTGYVGSFQEMTDIIAQRSIGLAPYVPEPGSFSFYADPSKIKLYMVCGLPVIATNVTTMSEQIVKTGTGKIINYSPTELADAISSLIKDQSTYDKYKKAAIKLSKQFDVNVIYDKAISQIPE